MTTRRPKLATALTLSALVGALVGNAGSPARAASLQVLSRRRIAPGIVYTRLLESSPLNHVFVLNVNVPAAPSLDVALASRAVGGFERTSSMASRYGALAAVNGDFTEWWGRPAHAFAEDGAFKFTAMRGGPQFALSRDETAAYTGVVSPTIRAALPGRTTPLPVTRWNAGSPEPEKVAAYSDAGTTRSPDGLCALLLRAAGPIGWTAGKAAVVQRYVVRGRRCGNGFSTRYRLVLAAHNGTAAGRSLAAVAPGTSVKVSWTLGWPDVHDTIGGFPVLVDAGRAVAPARCPSYFCDRNPRTAVGITPSGHVLLVVVDGRRPGWSAGLRLDEMANLMRSLGADRAMNLDGGGSSTMVVRGRVVNRPTDPGGERPVGSALVLLGGADAADPLVRAVPVSSSSVSKEASLRAGRAALHDPGSTGGLPAAG
jgi:hypothetical protein